MAYVNKAYQYHSHATVPVVTQQQQQQSLQSRGAEPQQPRVQSQSYQQQQQQQQHATRHVPVVYPSGRVYYSPHSALATGNRSSTMGARSNSTQSQSTPQSQSLGGSKASVVSKRSGKSSIHQEYQDKKVRSFLLAPYFGRGRLPYLIAICLTLFGILFIIVAGVVFGLRFHNNIMLTIDKGEIVGPILIVIGVVLLAGAMKFYFDAYSVSNKERQKVQFSATRDSMVQISVINANHRKKPGEPIVSGTTTNEAVTRTPHGAAAAKATRVSYQDRNSSAARNQQLYASGSARMHRSSIGTPVNYSATRRQPVESVIYYRNAVPVEAVETRNILDAAPNSSSGLAETDPNYSLRPAVKFSMAAGASPSGNAGASSSMAVGASPSRTAGASPSRTAGASPSRTAGASPSRTAGASPSRTAGASPSRTAGASPSRAAGASPSRTAGASPSRASASSPPVAVRTSLSRPPTNYSSNPSGPAPYSSMATATVPSSRATAPASSLTTGQPVRPLRSNTEV